MREVIDVAIHTDSYDELIGLCQGFLTSKKSIESESLNDSHHIAIEIHDSHMKKRRCLANIDTIKWRKRYQKTLPKMWSKRSIIVLHVKLLAILVMRIWVK